MIDRSSQNPFSYGSTPYGEDEDGQYPATVNGVYFDHKPVDPNNPYSAGSGSYNAQEMSDAQSVSSGVANLDDQRAQSPSSDPVDASNLELYDDQGYGPSGSGRS